MAETITQINQPAPFIEAAAKPYLTELTQAVGGLKSADLSQTLGPQFLADPGALQTQAEGLASGLGSYQPFLQTAAATTGPTGYQQFMSPYQQDVIDTTLADYDIQAQKGLGSIADQAYNAGAFGGGREGVQRAEYMSASDRNRAALQAQLLQQGFGQAQQAANTDFAKQIQLAQQTPALLGQQIASLSTLGSQQQAQEQARLSAQQQLAQAQLNQPLQAAQTLGAGITSLISGYPGGIQTQQQPTPSPLQTALSGGATLAGIYRALSK